MEDCLSRKEYEELSVIIENSEQMEISIQQNSKSHDDSIPTRSSETSEVIVVTTSVNLTVCISLLLILFQ